MSYHSGMDSADEPLPNSCCVAQHLVSGQHYRRGQARNDSNQRRDVFVRAFDAAVTSRVSVTTNGTQSNGYSRRPAISADGAVVAFEFAAENLSNGPDTNGARDIFVHNGATRRVSVDSSGMEANGESGWPAISADGRYMAFESSASNLSGAADTNGATDIFVYDLTTGVIVRVSVTSQGDEA